MSEQLSAVAHILLFLGGLLVVVSALGSAVRTFVLPRSAPDRLTRLVFLLMRSAFAVWTWRARSWVARDARFALYAPLSLLALPAVWLAALGVGYMAMYGSLGELTVYEVFELSGSSLFTLGFSEPPTQAM